MLTATTMVAAAPGVPSPPGGSNLQNVLSAAPECVSRADSWCASLWNATHIGWLAASADWLVAKPLRILLILVLAVIVRWIVFRMIDRATRDSDRAGRRKLPALLRPLRDRAHTGLGSVVTSARRRQRAQTIGSLLKSITSFIVFGIAFVLILGELGVNLGPIIASAGVVGLALGFGAQNLVRDFLSGMFMIVEDQYGVGDWVDVGPASGTVEAVGLRVTKLRDTGGTVWYVRNGEITRVGNYNQHYGVAVLDIPLGYGVDVQRACEIIEQSAVKACQGDIADDVLDNPLLWGVQQIGNEGVTVRLTVKAKAGRQFAVQRALRAAALTAIHDAGLQPPLAQLLPQHGQ